MCEVKNCVCKGEENFHARSIIIACARARDLDVDAAYVTCIDCGRILSSEEDYHKYRLIEDVRDGQQTNLLASLCRTCFEKRFVGFKRKYRYNRCASVLFFWKRKPKETS